MKSIKLLTLVFGLLLALTLVISACAPQATASPSPMPTASPSKTPIPKPTEAPTPAVEPLNFVDGLGRDVLLEEPAQRVVSLAPSNTEILFAVNAGEKTVGRDELSDFPPEAATVMSIGATYGELNTEAVVALDPDLVLAASVNTPEQVQSLEALGLTVYYLGNPEDFPGLYENLVIVGALTGHQDEAQSLADELASRVQSVEESLQNIEPVQVYYEVDGTDPNAPWTVGAGTFQQVLFDATVAENAFKDIQGWAQVSLEEIITRDPEVMFFAAGPWVPTTVESVAERSGWEGISAVATGRVYAIDTNWVDRPGPRLVDALEFMALHLHPEVFE